MLTKGIVEEVISPHQVRVRLPVLNGFQDTGIATDTEELNIATVCTLPNCYVNLQVGDVVFVGFEDNTHYKAVVLGHLSREIQTSTYVDLTVSSLTALGNVRLPATTQIGEVTAQEIACLSGIVGNIQKHIELLESRLTKLESK